METANDQVKAVLALNQDVVFGMFAEPFSTALIGKAKRSESNQNKCTTEVVFLIDEKIDGGQLNRLAASVTGRFSS